MKKKLLTIFACATFNTALADDWSATPSEINKIWYYGDTIIVEQRSGRDEGQANCENDSKWEFNQSDIANEAQRLQILSILLTYHSTGKELKPIFHDSECGDNGHKKFIGKFELR